MANAIIVLIWITPLTIVYLLHKFFYITVCLYIKAFLFDWKDIVIEDDRLSQIQSHDANLALKEKLIDAAIYHMKILKFVFTCC